MKRISRVITIALALLMVCITAISPASATYVYQGSFENKEGGFLGIGATSYTYDVYRDTARTILLTLNIIKIYEYSTLSRLASIHSESRKQNID